MGHAILAMLAMLGFYWAVASSARWIYRTFACSPIKSKAHYFWNRDKGAWWMYPEQVIGHKFDMNKTLNIIAVTIFVSFVGYLIFS